MPYELHIDARLVAIFATTEQALAHAREALRERAETEVEILDAATKQAVMPASSRDWREHLAREVGF